MNEITEKMFNYKFLNTHYTLNPRFNIENYVFYVFYVFYNGF